MLTFTHKQNHPQKPVSSSLARHKTATPAPEYGQPSRRHVQRAMSNQAVLRMFQRDAENPNFGLTAAASPCFGHDFSQIPIHPPAPVVIQTKLAINQPGDDYEQEANRISEHVMRMPAPRLQRACACGGGCPTCQTEQPRHEHERLQTKRLESNDLGQTMAPPIVQELQGSPGQALDTATRGFMESRFGHDFSKVRVHTDAQATPSPQALHARAYTVGSDIVFGERQFEPGTIEGKKLLAHELAHVVQQIGVPAFVQRAPATGGPLIIGDADVRSMGPDCQYERGEEAKSRTPAGILPFDVGYVNSLGIASASYPGDAMVVVDFKINDAVVRPAAESMLRFLVSPKGKVFPKGQEESYKVIGFSDCVGWENKVNAPLRTQRAQAVARILRAQNAHVNPTAAPYDDYLVPNTSQETRALNRAVVILTLSQQTTPVIRIDPNFDKPSPDPDALKLIPKNWDVPLPTNPPPTIPL